MDDSSSSDHENVNYIITAGLFLGLQQTMRKTRTHSILEKRPYEERQFDVAYQRLLNDYFVQNAKHSFSSFERRFSMRRSILDHSLVAVDLYGIFKLRKDATRKQSIRPLQRVVASLRMLAYGVVADAIDEYLQMSEDSVLKSFTAFSHLTFSRFGEE